MAEESLPSSLATPQPSAPQAPALKSRAVPACFPADICPLPAVLLSPRSLEARAHERSGRPRISPCEGRRRTPRRTFLALEPNAAPPPAYKQLSAAGVSVAQKPFALLSAASRDGSGPRCSAAPTHLPSMPKVWACRGESFAMPSAARVE